MFEEFGSSGIDDKFPNAQLLIVKKTPIWYEYIVKFLSTQQYHEGLDKNQHYKIRVNNSHFALITGKLYCWGVDGILRRCILYKEILSIWRFVMTMFMAATSLANLEDIRSHELDIFGQLFLKMLKIIQKHVMFVKGMHKTTLFGFTTEVFLPLLPLEKLWIDYIRLVAPIPS